MDTTLLVTSIALGLTVAAPIGPMSLLCINRTLTVSHRNGLVFGAGIAAADCTYAALAAFGLVGLSNAFAGAGHWLKILGAFLLIYLGVRLAWGRTDSGMPAPIRNAGIGAFASAYGLTLAKPQPGHPCPAALASFRSATASRAVSISRPRAAWCSTRCWRGVWPQAPGTRRWTATP